MSTTTQPSDVIAFIAARADETDLDNIINAVKARRTMLGRINAAAVKVGAAVRLDGLSPKYLNGLTGTVSIVSGGRCSVVLDEHSTTALRYAPRSRYAGAIAMLPEGEDRYTLSGIPTQCAKVEG